MLLISLKTIIEYILKELPTERLLTIKERRRKHRETVTKSDKKIPKVETKVFKRDKDGKSRMIQKSDDSYVIFETSEVTPFNPNVFDEIISSGYFNNVLINLVNLSLALESYKGARDYIIYNLMEDVSKHDSNIKTINRSMERYLKEINNIKKELNI